MQAGRHLICPHAKRRRWIDRVSLSFDRGPREESLPPQAHTLPVLTYPHAQRVSAAAMNRPAPISNARASPASIEKARRRRSAGLLSAASVCAAKNAIQKLFMDRANSCRRGVGVFGAPLRTGPAHIMRFGPVPARWRCHCGSPSTGHSRTCLDNGEDESVSYVREVLTHPNSSEGKSSMCSRNVLPPAYEFERDARASL